MLYGSIYQSNNYTIYKNNMVRINEEEDFYAGVRYYLSKVILFIHKRDGTTKKQKACLQCKLNDISIVKN